MSAEQVIDKGSSFSHAALVASSARARSSCVRPISSSEGAQLAVFVLMLERAVAGGASLPDMVQKVRGRLGDGQARCVFEEKLLAYGYHDVHRAKYDACRFIVHGRRVFEVKAGFPRLTSGLPAGVGDLSYTVTLAACTRFGIDESVMTGVLSSLNI